MPLKRDGHRSNGVALRSERARLSHVGGRSPTGRGSEQCIRAGKFVGLPG
jgi:hypothetical protein